MALKKITGMPTRDLFAKSMSGILEAKKKIEGNSGSHREQHTFLNPMEHTTLVKHHEIANIFKEQMSRQLLPHYHVKFLY